MVPLKRASAPLYFRGEGVGGGGGGRGGFIVIDCTLIHASQCTSPARASVLNQRPTKMGYTRPLRGEIIGISQTVQVTLAKRFRPKRFERKPKNEALTCTL